MFGWDNPIFATWSQGTSLPVLDPQNLQTSLANIPIQTAQRMDSTIHQNGMYPQKIAVFIQEMMINPWMEGPPSQQATLAASIKDTWPNRRGKMKMICPEDLWKMFCPKILWGPKILSFVRSFTG